MINTKLLALLLRIQEWHALRRVNYWRGQLAIAEEEQDEIEISLCHYCLNRWIQKKADIEQSYNKIL